MPTRTFTGGCGALGADIVTSNISTNHDRATAHFTWVRSIPSPYACLKNLISREALHLVGEHDDQ
jgi:hypothetical protein